MAQVCPINSATVNNRVVRVVASFVVAVAAAFLIWPQWPLFYLLAADFLLRSLGYRKYSPLATSGRAVAGILGLEPQPVNAGPKQFAAKIGVAFSLTAGTLALLGFVLAARIVATGLLGAASLEAVFGFCVGCRIFALLPNRSAEPESVSA